jgi:hypothetical protein
LLIGQISFVDAKFCQNDDVKPLNLLKSSFSIKANVYYGDEDEEKIPIADTEFYLLDKNLIKVLKDFNFKPEFLDSQKHNLEDEDYLTATAKAFISEDVESTLIRLLIKKQILKHQVFSLKTDYQGQAKVNSVKEGNYYLFGIGKAEDEILVWHFPVSIKLGTNVIEIDQYNANTLFFTEVLDDNLFRQS